MSETQITDRISEAELGERTERIPALSRLVDAIRFGARRVFEHLDERTDAAVYSGDPRQKRVRDVPCAQLAVAHRGGELGRGLCRSDLSPLPQPVPGLVMIDRVDEADRTDLNRFTKGSLADPGRWPRVVWCREKMCLSPIVRSACCRAEF